MLKRQAAGNAFGAAIGVLSERAKGIDAWRATADKLWEPLSNAIATFVEYEAIQGDLDAVGPETSETLRHGIDVLKAIFAHPNFGLDRLSDWQLRDLQKSLEHQNVDLGVGKIDSLLRTRAADLSRLVSLYKPQVDKLLEHAQAAGVPPGAAGHVPAAAGTGAQVFLAINAIKPPLDALDSGVGPSQAISSIVRLHLMNLNAPQLQLLRAGLISVMHAAGDSTYLPEMLGPYIQPVNNAIESIHAGG